MKIFYDVDTQNDFMNENGALYVPDAELIKENLNILTSYALHNKVPLVGSVDRHFGTKEYKDREGELQVNGGPFPNHCMDGTKGQEKIEEINFVRTFIENVLGTEKYPDNITPSVYNRNCVREAKQYQKIRFPSVLPVFFEKQELDVFTNPLFETFLKQAKVNQAVVYGVATDYCVKAAVLGMQDRNIQCYVVEDAIKGVDVQPGDSEKAIEEMQQAGAKLVTLDQVLEDKLK